LLSIRLTLHVFRRGEITHVLKGEPPMFLSPRLTAFTLLCWFVAASSAFAAVQYPVDGDGSINVNILRKYDLTGLRTQVSELNWLYVGGANEAATLDISVNKAQWDYNGQGDRADATATIRWELDQAYSVNKWISHWRNNTVFKPFEYELRMSDTGFSSMDVIVSRTATPSATVTDIFSPRDTRYVEMQWWGVPERNGGREAVLLDEVEMFAHEVTQGPITADQGFAIKNAYNFTFTDESDPDGGFRDSLSKVADGNFRTFLRGNGGADDARHLVGHLAAHLTGPRAADAIMCGSDGQTITLAAACRQLHLEPGEDVAVVGYDNYWRDVPSRKFEPYVPPATVDKRNTDSGAAMVRLLLDRMEGKLPDEPVVRRIDPVLVETDKADAASITEPWHVPEKMKGEQP
jgi:hypothetical protein